MNIVEINTVNRGSTGNIMRGVTQLARSHGHRVLVCYPKSRDNAKSFQKGDYYIGNRLTRNLGRILSKHFRAEHIIHASATLMLIVKLIKFSPDIIHIHNIHDTFINIPLFFFYIRKKKIRVIWTLHDCWLYTGHCPHYIEQNCYKWESCCYECPSLAMYPSSRYDDSSYKYELKKKIIQSIKQQLIIVPVSEWLSGEVSRSFLSNIERVVVSNGIDLNVFKSYCDESIKDKYNLPSGRIMLATATTWNKNKGLFDYIKLARMLDDEEYIILVGVTRDIMSTLPSNIIGIERMDNKEDLARLYSLADVILSLSYAETFGMSIIEGMACGTPVVVYDNTAQPELIDGRNGLIAKNKDIDSVLNCVKKVFSWNAEETKQYCTQYAKKYDESRTYLGYLSVFHLHKCSNSII